MRFTPVVRNAKSSQALSQRVRRPAYLQRLARAEDLPPLFRDGDYVYISLAISASTHSFGRLAGPDSLVSDTPSWFQR